MQESLTTPRKANLIFACYPSRFTYPISVMRNILKIDGRVQWHFVQAPKTGAWIAACHPLKLTVQAQTWAELMESIAETLDGVLGDVLKRGELDSFLHKQGWQHHGEIPNRRTSVRFDLPWETRPMTRHDREAVFCQ